MGPASITQRPRATLDPLDLPAGPWMSLARAVGGLWQPLCLGALGAVPFSALLPLLTLTWRVIYATVAKGHWR